MHRRKTSTTLRTSQPRPHRLRTGLPRPPIRVAVYVRVPHARPPATAEEITDQGTAMRAALARLQPAGPVQILPVETTR